MPALTVTAQTAYRVPRVDIVLSGYSAGAAVTVSRRDPDGRTRPVRGAEPLQLDAAGFGTVSDHEAPYGATLHYRVTGGGLPLQDRVRLDSPRPVLVSPGNPAGSFVLGFEHVGPDSLRELPAEASTTDVEVVGRPEPVPVTQGVRKSPSGTLQVLTHDMAEAALLRDLLAPSTPVLLNIPAHFTWPMSSAYIRIAGATPRRIGSTLSDPLTLWDLPFRVVSRPVGSFRQLWTWDRVTERYRSWDDLSRHFRSWNALTLFTPTEPTP